MRESSSSRRTVSELQRLRLERGLSRDRLAALAGITPRCLYGLEIERRRPRQATAEALSLVLGIDIGWLFPPVPSNPGDAAVAG